MDWTQQLALPDGLITITPFSTCSIGKLVSPALDILSSFVWPSAGKAIHIPFRLNRPIVVKQMFTWNGATASGNLDIGIHSADGTLIISKGSTAQAGINALQTLDITDTQVGPGLFYMSLTHSNITGTYFRGGLIQAKLEVIGIVQSTDAPPFAATAAFAVPVNFTNYIPAFGLTARSVI